MQSVRLVLSPSLSSCFCAHFSFLTMFLSFSEALSFFLTCRLSLLFLLSFFFLPSKSPPPPKNTLCALAREHGDISRPFPSPRLPPTSPSCQKAPSATQAGNVCVCICIPYLYIFVGTKNWHSPILVGTPSHYGDKMPVLTQNVFLVSRLQLGYVSV